MGCILRNPISDTRTGGCSYVLAIEINYFDVLPTEGVVRDLSAVGNDDRQFGTGTEGR